MLARLSMQPERQRKYALNDYTVEWRTRGWYFGRPYQTSREYRGPYSSIASVTLSIARLLRREIERRDRANAEETQAPIVNGSNVPTF